MSHDMKKSSSEKRAEREQVLHGQQCRYSRMERDGRCEVFMIFLCILKKDIHFRNSLLKNNFMI